MRKIFVIGASVLFSGAAWSATLSQAVAEPPSAVAAPVDPKLALAQQIVVATGGAGSLHRMMGIVADAIAGNLGALGKDPEMQRYTVKLFKEETDRMISAYIPKMAEIYAETFDEQELRDLLAFYTSPVGQRLVEKQPELSRRGVAAVQPMILPMQVDMIDKLFEHICAVRQCTADQRKAMESAKLQLLERFKAQAAATAAAATKGAT